jgi:hypothetical protein
VIAQATGWQRLRTMSLDTVPSGTRVYHVRAVPLNLWRDKGSFTVISCTKNQVSIEASASEIGGALLADTEYLLDHAAEHQASLRDAVVVQNWHSPAWMLVTLYYWGFFSALALTRISGSSAWFLDKKALNQFKTLAGSAMQPGAGALYLVVDAYVSATVRRMSLRPSKSQLHDASWTVAMRLITEIFKHCDRNVNLFEYRFWSALKRIGDLWGADWASKLRNAINYRPGYGYREVIKDKGIDSIRYLRQQTPIAFHDLVDVLESETAAIRFGSDPSTDIALASRLLGLFSISLAMIVQTLHAEVIIRQSGDIRWKSLRNSFFSARCSTASGGSWPFA